MNLRDTLDDLHKSKDGRAGRVYGWVVGHVTQLESPTANDYKGRVKARMGDQDDGEESDWLIPLWPGSIESSPRKNDMLVIGFIDGDPHRGFFACHPTSNTQNRASEWAMLGIVTGGIINNLSDQVETIKSKLNACVTDISAILNAINVTGLAVSGAIAKMATPVPQNSSGDSDPTAAKCQKADGSTVPSVTVDSKALSGNVKIGK